MDEHRVNWQKFNCPIRRMGNDQKVYKIEFKFIIEDTVLDSFKVTDLAFQEQLTATAQEKHILEDNVVTPIEKFFNCICRGTKSIILPNGSKLDGSKKLTTCLSHCTINVDTILRENQLRIRNNIRGKPISNIANITVGDTLVLDGYTSLQYLQKELKQCFIGGYIKLANCDNKLTIEVPKNEQVTIKLKYRETEMEE